FLAEIFRAGIQSISPGQWDAARALGMSYRQQMQRIILPQAIKRMVPAFANRGAELFKLTALAATISYQELLYTGKNIAAAYYNPVESYTVIALIYFVLIYPMMRLMYGLERRWRRAG
ncbi:MAG: amino acid ABC transporter permease, partial [Pseudorhodoplanes sp.]